MIMGPIHRMGPGSNPKQAGTLHTLGHTEPTDPVEVNSGMT